MKTATVAGVNLAVANVEGELLAYRDACADCGAPIGDAELSEGVLACSACSRRYFLPRAGRSLDDDKLYLEPVPLLSDSADGIRVALAS